MREFTIMADGTCDLSEQFRKEYDIKVVMGHLVLPENPEARETLTWQNTTREEFYTALKKNPDKYATAPANIDEMAMAMEEEVKNGKDVLMILISGGMSGAVNFATGAKEKVLEKYPDAVISIVDSRRFGPAIGLMAIHAANFRAQGMDVKETTEAIEKIKNTFHQTGWLDDLSFVAKKGRITHSKAFFGQLVGIKPIGEFDYNGMTTIIGKAKGAKKAFPVLLSYIEETAVDIENQIVFIATTNERDQAEKFKQMIEEKFHPKAVYVNDVFPSCGINIGPGLMAAYYTGKPISEGLVEERAILEKYLNA